MLSIRGPRRWAITFASTSMPLSCDPTWNSSPSLTITTRPSLTEDPGSAARRSTRIRSPGATRYCLPPLTTTADAEISGLGTASDCTKRWDPLLEDDGPRTEHHRLDQPECRQRGDRGRAAI